MKNRINDFLKQLFDNLTNVFHKEIFYWRIWLSLFVIGLLVLLVWAASLRWASGWVWADWTGFGRYLGDLENDDRGKTLWDWIGLLGIPIVLAVVAYWLNRSEKANEYKIAENRNQEAILQNYLDKISELILDKGLMDEKKVWENINTIADEDAYKVALDNASKDPKCAVRDMAQIRTITVIRQLSRDRRNIVFQFLRDAKLADFLLISASLPKMELDDTNLSDINLARANLFLARLTDANLVRANLHNAHLIGSNLARASLVDANLTGAVLFGADLTRAILADTNLSGADLTNANLTGACLIRTKLTNVHLENTNLHDAILRGADLTMSTVTTEQLAFVQDLDEATMPNGEKYNPVVHGALASDGSIERQQPSDDKREL